MKIKPGILIWDNIDGEFGVIVNVKVFQYDIFWSNSGYSSTPTSLFEDVMDTTNRWELFDIS